MRVETIDIADVSLGQEVTVVNVGGWSQGGAVEKVEDNTIEIVSPNGNHHAYTIGDEWSIQVEVAIPADECIEYDPETCRGAVDYFSVDGRGTRFPRCQHHIDRRIERYNDPKSSERFAYSDLPPSDFDPTLCNEVWSEEEY